MKVICDNRGLLQEDVSAGDHVLIGGDLAFVSLEDGEALPEGMVVQPPRPGSFKLFKDTAPVVTGVDNGVISLMRGSSGVKFSLIVDAYINYLRGRADSIVLIGGAATDTGTNLEFFVLEDRCIKLVLDKFLPKMGSLDFSAELVVALEDITTRLGYSELPPVHWAYPLPELASPPSGYDFRYVDLRDFGKVKYLPIYTAEKKITSVKAYLAPAVMVLVAFAIAAGLVFWQWSRYTDYKATLKKEMSGMEATYEQGAKRIQLLNSQQFMLDAPLPQAELLKRWNRIASALKKGEGLTVQRIAIFGDKSTRVGLGGRSTNFEIDVDVLARPELSERVQAKQILMLLAAETGYEMWLKPVEITTDAGYRKMLIEGVINAGE
ncbi:hypothetical protein [Geopseudomonas aromaticivorans]